MIIVFCISLFPFALTYSQAVEKSDCKLNLETIFEVHALKIKVEKLRYFHMESKKEHSFLMYDKKNGAFILTCSRNYLLI